MGVTILVLSSRSRSPGIPTPNALFIQSLTARMRLFLSILTIFPLRILASNLANRATTPTTCNGWPEICDMSYANVTVLGAHDAPFTSTTALALTRDQEISVIDQLNNGVRLIQGQLHLCPNSTLPGSNLTDMCLCHNPCNVPLTYNAGLAINLFAQIYDWLKAHPTELVTMLFTNGDYLDVKTYIEPVYNLSGLASMAWSPPKWPILLNEFPTYGELLAMGVQVVVYVDYYEPFYMPNTSSAVSYILDEFSGVAENPFTQTDNFFNGSLDRINTTYQPASEHMCLLNAIKDIGGVDSSEFFAEAQLNSWTMLAWEAANMSNYCNGKNPAYILTDFTDIGDGLMLVNYLNNLGNTSAINITSNGTTSGALSLHTVFKIQGAGGAGYYYTSLLGAAFFSVLAMMMVV